MNVQQHLFVNHPKHNRSARNSTLWELMDEYRRGLLLKPPHQRDIVWDSKKIADWNTTLLEDTVIGTSFVTYQIEHDDGYCGPVYLNDGYNRVALAGRFYENCTDHGLTPIDAEARLRCIEICRVHMHHRSIDEAVYKFQQLNKGTGLTPLEMNKYHLAYLSDHTRQLIELVVSAVAEAEKYLVGRESATRDKKHKMNRDAYALFLRWLDTDMGRTDYIITGNRRDIVPVEQLLRDKANDLGNDFERQVKAFVTFVENERAIIESAWKPYIDQSNVRMSVTGLSQTTFRFCLHIGIWRRHRGLPIDMHMQWLSSLFAASGGRSAVLVGDVHETITNGRLSPAWSICELIGQAEYGKLLRGDTKHKRKRERSQPPGIDNSHILPFAKHGNGPTIPEPALLNRARGARPHPMAGD